MLKLIAKLFGTKSDKDIKRVMPLVEQTKQEGERLQSLSHDALRAETETIRNVIDDGLKNIDEQLAALHTRIADNPSLELDEK